ncbi:putative Amino acid transporter [Spironucleus salmonicida]|uniref:Amino acid transporter n=1 Tax=Spironucleus salmonicida TaxID=348837 RepID=V6LS90_9EUKA|nr:putative Amino acid transporter [Spironucleus salmonicida]|eukprot:EST47123.1 Amino acid transporter family protein [Spironucleus salmonicida]
MPNYKAFTASAVLINFTIGVGILNLPQTVARASIVVSLILITIITFLGYLLGRYSIDIVSRTFALQRCIQVQNLQEAENQKIEIQTTLEEQPIDEITSPDFSLPNDATYEFSEMCQIYYGTAGKIIYLIAVCCLTFGAMWSYTAIVAQSIASIVPFGASWECGDPCQVYSSRCNIAYFVWTFVAIVYTSIMIFFDISKQNVLQTILTAIRITAVLIIAIIPFVAMFLSPFDVNGNTTSAAPFIKNNIPVFKFEISTFSSVFSSSIYAIILHSAIPTTMRPVVQQHQKYLNRAMTLAFGVIYVLMAIVAYPSAMYFGTDGAQLITLNLLQWDGKSWGAQHQPVFFKFLSYLVRILPPIYVIGSMPIVALSMSANLKQISPKTENSRVFDVAFKLASVIPAGILAGFFRCLGSIIDVSGLFAFVVLLSPAVLLLRARKRCREEFAAPKTPFSGFLDQNWVIFSIISIFAVGFAFTVYGLINGFLK